MHGFAFNVAADLSGFELIVPCGILDHDVTSIAALKGDAPPVASVAAESLPIFADVFERSIGPLTDAATRDLSFEALGVGLARS